MFSSYSAALIYTGKSWFIVLTFNIKFFATSCLFTIIRTLKTSWDIIFHKEYPLLRLRYPTDEILVRYFIYELRNPFKLLVGKDIIQMECTFNQMLDYNILSHKVYMICGTPFGIFFRIYVEYSFFFNIIFQYTPLPI